MRPFTHTLPVAEAMRLVLETAVPLSRTEHVALGEARGRVLASPVAAGADVPPFARAAMDGYAVLTSDFESCSADRVTLARVGVVYAGDPPPASLARGTCVEIATGAPTPPGDGVAVVMVEETRADGDRIVFRSAPAPRQHVTRRGSDIEAGTVVGRPGDVLTAARLGAIAATGVAGVDVVARPRVVIVSTGNELVAPGHPLAPGQIYDINRFTLAAIVEEHGGTAATLPLAGDSLAELRAALDAMGRYDLAVFSGGSSVGDRDLMLDVLRERGDIVFHGIAVKPGKPTALAKLGATVVFAMPGNPTSCLSNAYIFLIPLLRRLARLPVHEPRRVRAPLEARVASTPGRHHFHTVRLVDGVAASAFKGSGDITSMSRADGYVEIPADIDALEAGTIVDVTLF